MHFADFKHEAKSVDAYLFDTSTLHIRLIAKKGITNNVKIIYGDPFYHAKNENGEHKWAPYGDGLPMIKRGS
ncbi:alpha amylase N-terminal ig-like domain-containing protein, partial [Methanocalculus natronophilus]|uniref:alpha amylase N-terminal ig-like domain-containing protein n=1 Tax=Methanocalculus natronophilus TaxID=1262400 RepID=UPI0031B59CDE